MKCDRLKLFFNHDVHVQYRIERDLQIIDFYKQHSLSYYQGLNNFLQIDSDHRDEWINEHYTCLRQPLHSTPERINTPQLHLDIPQFTFSDLKPKYSQFWETDNSYFIGGET